METETPQNDIEQTSETEDDEQEEKIVWYLDWKVWLKIFIVLIVIVAIIIAIVYNKETGNALTSFLNWMKNNPVLGSFAFIGVYWFCTVFFIPGSLLTFGAGFVFRVVAGPWGGVFLGTLVVIIGASLGASTAFLLGRFVLRDKVASYKSKYEKFDTIDRVVEEQGLKVTILLRLSPIIPFNVFNYAMGLTAVSFRDYNIAHIGMIPGTLAYCFIGGTLGAIGETAGFGDDPTILIVTIVGTVVAVAGMIYISWVAKKEFAKIAARNQENAVNAEQAEDAEVARTSDDDNNETEQNNDTDPLNDNNTSNYNAANQENAENEQNEHENENENEENQY